MTAYKLKQPNGYTIGQEFYGTKSGTWEAFECGDYETIEDARAAIDELRAEMPEYRDEPIAIFNIDADRVESRYPEEIA